MASYLNSLLPSFSERKLWNKGSQCYVIICRGTFLKPFKLSRWKVLHIDLVLFCFPLIMSVHWMTVSSATVILKAGDCWSAFWIVPHLHTSLALGSLQFSSCNLLAGSDNSRFLTSFKAGSFTWMSSFKKRPFCRPLMYFFLLLQGIQDKLLYSEGLLSLLHPHASVF